MKKTKLISLFLAFCALISCLAILSSCDDGNGDKETGTKIDTPGWYSDVDFKAAKLKIDQSINLWDMTNSIDNAAKYTQGPQQKGEDEVQNLCYDRNLAVEATLNLTLDFRTTDLKYSDIMPYYDNLFSTATVPDIIINDVYPVIPMALNGQLVNAKNTNSSKYGENYFNFDAKIGEEDQECWYNYFMEGLTLDENKIYAVAGDYFMDVIRSAHCLYLNTELFATKVAPGSRWSNVGDFYDYVERRLWTYDDFANMANLAWDDGIGTSEGITDQEDVLGFLHNNSAGLFPFVFGAQISVVSEGQNGLQINQSSLSLSNFITSLINLTSMDGVLAVDSTSYNFRQKFTSNEALFVGSYWMGDLEFSSFKNMEKKAAIVYPMARTANGEYRTYVHDSAEIGYIPINTMNPANFSMASAFLQLSCELSTPIIDVYFNEALKYRDNTDSAAVKMLDVIHETIDSSYNQFVIGQIATLGNAENRVFDIVQESVKADQDKSAQLYAANITAYEAGLRALVEKFNGLS